MSKEKQVKTRTTTHYVLRIDRKALRKISLAFGNGLWSGTTELSPTEHKLTDEEIAKLEKRALKLGFALGFSIK